MKKSLIALAVLGASSVAFAASNVTLYGVVDMSVVGSKANHVGDATVTMESGFRSGSRWGIKGVEDLGNGYNVGFVLESGFTADDGVSAQGGRLFGRESQVYVQGGFGKLGFGRFGSLASGAGSYHMLTGWALGTSYTQGSWKNVFGTLRVNNAVAYMTPNFGGLTLGAMYSNSDAENDDSTNKWSKNNHYYGVGAKYANGPLTSSLIFEVQQQKAAADNKNAKYNVDFGFAYDLGSITPMFAYRYDWQDEGQKLNTFGLSAKAPVAGGTVMAGVRYYLGKDDGAAAGEEDKLRSWTINAAYEYPLSKRTTVWGYGGYADGSKIWKDSSDKGINGWSVGVGMTHTF